MAMVVFKCNNPNCKNKITKIFKKTKDIPPFLDCGACGTGKLERQLGSPSSHKTQMIDNGLYARKVEVRDAVVEKAEKKLHDDTVDA